jgi:hypothetical protein
VYPVAASGTPVPVRTLQGTEYWGDIGADADGNIFVAVEGSECNGVINVYGPTATGSDAPNRTIAFENGQQPVGLAVDASGDIFAIEGDCYGNWAIEEFAAGAEGLASPINTINLPPLPAGATEGDGFVRLDAAANIFAAVLIATPSDATSAIYGYVPTATGHAAPTVTINYGAQWPLFALN